MNFIGLWLAFLLLLKPLFWDRELGSSAKWMSSPSHDFSGRLLLFLERALASCAWNADMPDISTLRPSMLFERLEDRNLLSEA